MPRRICLFDKEVVAVDGAAFTKWFQKNIIKGKSEYFLKPEYPPKKEAETEIPLIFKILLNQGRPVNDEAIENLINEAASVFKEVRGRASEGLKIKVVDKKQLVFQCQVWGPHPDAPPRRRRKKSKDGNS